jgi:DNA-binding NarL/FixJ family response regulator
MKRPTVVVVDDHRIFAEGLLHLLGDRYEILAVLNDGAEVVQTTQRLRPDVLLLDLSMPQVSGLEAIRQLRKQAIAFKAIVLTMHADANIAVEVLKAGASGFLLKESTGGELLKALDTVIGGGTYLAANLTKEVVRLMVGATDPLRVELTGPQREVLRLIVRGHRAKEIAGLLTLSTRSVEAIKYRTMQLLNVHSTAELVRYAMEHHLVTF